MWVIAWKPYDPGGLFVHSIGDFNEGQNAVVAERGVHKAMRFRSLGEAVMFLDSVKEMNGHTYWKDWLIVNLEDHDEQVQ